ncbi:MAG: nucleoside 2-deoxyribosyltransferase [Proteobacteria bacterium]|nr:nucleoside 2-deoxyribosyltransferase [Pseudomonadota bacterium]
MTRIYLAGPLFTLAERRFNRELAAALESLGGTVILPQEADHDLDHAAQPEAIFRRCLDDLDRAQAVVAVLDGPDADAGTAFECGYCYARGVPVVGLRTDLRGGAEPMINAMLRRAVTHWFEVDPVGADLGDVARRLWDRLRSERGGGS